MKEKSFWARFYAVIAVPVGIIFIVTVFLASSPNAPSWTRHVLPVMLIVYWLVIIVCAILDYKNRRFVAARRRLVMTVMTLLLGVICGAGAILASTPNPPSWTRYAMPVLAVSGLAIVFVWSLLHFGRKANGSVPEK
jgi:hypothetical protein